MGTRRTNAPIDEYAAYLQQLEEADAEEEAYRRLDEEIERERQREGEAWRERYGTPWDAP